MLCAQSCPTLCDPVDCSPPGSSAHGILQARVLEWGAIAFPCLSRYSAPSVVFSSKYVVSEGKGVRGRMDTCM